MWPEDAGLMRISSEIITMCSVFRDRFSLLEVRCKGVPYENLQFVGQDCLLLASLHARFLARWASHCICSPGRKCSPVSLRSDGPVEDRHTTGRDDAWPCGKF